MDENSKIPAHPEQAHAPDATLPSLAGAAWLEAPACQSVFNAISAGGFDARVVGGATRNALLGEAIQDVDIATTAQPQDVVRLARAAGLGAFETGEAHGTITVVSDHKPFEVTTLRRDVETFGRRAVVQFTTDWTEDAGRRDFTINALYCDRHGTVFDPMGGYPDILARRVRFIGDPAQRIREDYLRILRFFRFHATYGVTSGNGAVDAAGLEACVAERDGLTTLSGERIRAEMLRLLVAAGALQAVDTMVQSGIADIILGQPGDVPMLSRVVAIEEALRRSPDVILRLAALSCRTPEDASKLAARWKFSNIERGQLEAAAHVQPDLGPAVDLAQAKALRFQHPSSFYERAYIMAWARSGVSATDHDWSERFKSMTSWRVPEVPFKGADIVALGVPPGPDVGIALRQFREWWINAGFPDDETLLRRQLLAIAQPFIDRA